MLIFKVKYAYKLPSNKESHFDDEIQSLVCGSINRTVTFNGIFCFSNSTILIYKRKERNKLSFTYEIKCTWYHWRYF